MELDDFGEVDGEKTTYESTHSKGALKVAVYLIKSAFSKGYIMATDLSAGRGKLTETQEPKAKALLRELEERVVKRLKESGWKKTTTRVQTRERETWIPPKNG